MWLSASVALSFVLSVLLVRALASPMLARGVLDVPNERSLHERPVPRSGGIGLLTAAGVSWWLFSGPHLRPVLGLAASLALISLLDDVWRLPIAARLLAQSAAAAGLLSTLAVAPPLLLPALFVGILWMTNLYNFMDGADGLAGGMTSFGFAGYALAATLAGAHELAVASAAVAAAAAGFLVWNFHPARIFLGDCGSVPLGFLAAAIGVTGWAQGVWPAWFPVVLFAPFIADATATLLRRAARGANVFAAHREHYYQRVSRSGFGQKRTVLASYGLMALCLCLALLFRDAGAKLVLLLLILLSVAILAGAIALEHRLARLAGRRAGQ